jgi:Tol biopolymer transport system component
MSPEQVRGKPADHRSDLFAFGAILYEMISGKRAFHGETPADTMSAILKEDPPELSETARNVPPALERVVHHCLEKNPAARFQSASDVAFSLEALTDISATSRSGLRAMAGPSRSRWLIPAIVGLLLAVSYGAVYFLAIRNRSISAPSFHRLTFRRGTIWAARFAPDGQTIVYSAAWDGKPDELFTTRFDSTDSRPLGLDHTELLAISSSGEMAVALGVHPIAAFTTEGTLARVPLAGGAPREVTENVEWADWSRDGQSLALIRTTRPGGNQLEYPLGKVIYTPNGWVSHVRVSPKGDVIAVADHLVGGDDGRVVIVDLEGNKKAASSFYTTLQGVSWSPDGKEVWFTAAPAGAARAQYAMNLAGKERLVYRVPGTLTVQDISRDGRVLLSEDNAQIGLSALPPGETHERNLSWFDWTLMSDLSPDGRTIVFSETGEAVGGHYGIFLRKTDGSAAIRLGDGTFASLSPDGKWVAAVTNSSPTQIQLLPTGVGEPKLLTHDQLDHDRLTWLPDGKRIIFIGGEPSRPPRIYLLDLADGKSRPITPEGVTSGPRISTDGTYVLAARDRQRWLYPIQGGEPRLLPGFDAGDVVVQWNDTGMLVAKRGIPTKIVRLDANTSRQQDWKVIASPDPAGIQSLPVMRFSADRKSYAYSYYRVLSDLYVVEGLK